MTNSREKGKRGELEFAHFLTDNGYPARRGQQFKGTDDSPDVICEELGDMNIEVKRREKFSINDIYAAMVKASEQDPDRMPMVAYRSNGQPWMICMSGEDFLAAMKGL